MAKKTKLTRLPVNEQEHWETVNRLSSQSHEAMRIPSKKAPLRERMKFEAAQLIARYLVEHKLSQVQLAERLKINRSLVSKITRGRLEEFGLDRLTEYVESLYPKATGHFKVAS
jgi:predicted XRE-type DNA-binding protein